MIGRAAKSKRTAAAFLNARSAAGELDAVFDLLHHDAVETEALGQTVIVGIVRDRLNTLLPEPLADVLEREQAQRVRIRAALRKLARGTR